ncbi:uncharacterized protein EDB91DRAFT_1345081 [Suillus paluster]|uniref:uncharacterized protein n=1 Tax=Suillus paluster TaxID=48578 RepID=UPI001B8757CC|nr:uncharacterized protein EDB91DRAFT_1345081 [Suillus paluster]KAG1747904.1 hypothetical protein EDB91DRAFT_1345081 [Suillus paluster]
MPHTTHPPTKPQNRHHHHHRPQHRTRPAPPKSAFRRTQPKAVNVNAETESEAESGSESVSDESFGDAHDDDNDADAPRVVQWVDAEDEDEDSEALVEEETDLDDDEDNINVIPSAKSSRELWSLEDNLSSLPLGMLRKAQHTLSQTRALTDSESESDALEDSYSSNDEDECPILTTSKGKSKEIPETEKHSRARKDLAKRSSKHAPTEITSKRPVSRRRIVIDSKTPQPRDPRFLHITGTFDPQKFRTQYTFLSTLHKDELSTLRSNLKRARKLLLNSPADQRLEREREVGRLELAVKRGESAVNRDKREKVEMEALGKVAREEKEKRGRGEIGVKKELLMKARYEDIASSGGKRAVKKAIEKKQKKTSQKEKRSRPFPASADNGWGQKRPARFAPNEEGKGSNPNPSKRRKIV